MCKLTTAAKRGLIAIPLGIAFGVLCAYLASTTNPAAFDLSKPLFWAIVFNRFLIGFIICLAGVYMRHPVFGFRFYPFVRGTLLGALISLDMAIGSLIAPVLPNAAMSPMAIFWASIAAGAAYGLIIDVLASRFGAEGETMLIKKRT